MDLWLLETLLFLAHGQLLGPEGGGWGPACVPRRRRLWGEAWDTGQLGKWGSSWAQRPVGDLQNTPPEPLTIMKI